MKHLLPLVAVVLTWSTSHGLSQNLVGQLDHASRPKATPTDLCDDTANASPGKRSLDALIATKFDVDFQDDSLALVLARLETLVAEASPALADRFAIRILGNDLKFEGITKNQRLKDLKLKQTTLAEILTVIVSRANPFRAARDPSDPRQILVWAIGPDPQAEGKKAVLITTRRGAKAKGLPLPAVFLAEPAWSEVISAGTLEDEIKAVSLALPQAVSNPNEFRGRGYKEARLQFNELAIVFAAISQYDKPMRWQEKAASLARMFARTAATCKVGTLQSFDMAKQSRGDLTDLVGGGNVKIPDGLQAPIENWDSIYDRAPVMKRMERALSRTLSKHLDDKSDFAANKDAIVSQAELIGLISTVIRQKGSEDADDTSYVNHARQLSFEARALVDSARADDLAGAKAAVARIKHACTQCHAEFR